MEMNDSKALDVDRGTAILQTWSHFYRRKELVWPHYLLIKQQALG